MWGPWYGPLLPGGAQSQAAIPRSKGVKRAATPLPGADRARLTSRIVRVRKNAIAAPATVAAVAAVPAPTILAVRRSYGPRRARSPLPRAPFLGRLHSRVVRGPFHNVVVSPATVAVVAAVPAPTVLADAIATPATVVVEVEV